MRVPAGSAVQQAWIAPVAVHDPDLAIIISGPVGKEDVSVVGGDLRRADVFLQFGQLFDISIIT